MAIFPFGEMEAVASGLRRSARAGRLGRVAMGVGLAVPLLIVAGGLLLSADQAFYNFFEGLTNSLADTLTEVVAKAVLSLLIGVYLCCFYLQAEREKTPALRPQREGDPGHDRDRTVASGGFSRPEEQPEFQRRSVRCLV